MVVDFAIPVQIGFVDHLLHRHVAQGNGVQPHNLFDVGAVELAVLVGVQFVELLAQECVIHVGGAVEETGNKLRVVDVAAVVEVHGSEDLVDVILGQLQVHLLPEVVQPHLHFLLGDHAVSVLVQLQEYFADVLDFLLGDLHC